MLKPVPLGLLLAMPRVRNLTSLRSIPSHWPTPGFTLQNMLAVKAMQYTLKDDNEKKSIRIRISILKIDIWRSKLLFHGCKLHFLALL